MSARRPCRDCAAYAPPSNGDIDGTCRRHAPVIAEGEMYFPPVLPDHWCIEALEPWEDDA